MTEKFLEEIKIELCEISNQIGSNISKKYNQLIRKFGEFIKEFLKKKKKIQNIQSHIIPIINSNNSPSTTINFKINYDTETISNNTNSNNLYNLNNFQNSFIDIKIDDNQNEYNIKLLQYKCLEIIFLIFSYGNVFINHEYKTSIKTFDFFSDYIEYINKLFDENIMLSIFNKIFYIFKNFDEDFQKEKEEEFRKIFNILRKLLDKKNKEDFLIFNKYQSKLNSLNNKEKKKKEENILIKSENIPFVPIINLSESVKDFLNKPEALLNLFDELNNESKIIEKMNQKHDERIFIGLSEINKQYIYIFKKIIDKIDSNYSNETLKQIYLNIIFRSTTFLKYLQKLIKEKNEKNTLKNVDIFISDYIKFGKFLYEMFLKQIDLLSINEFEESIEKIKNIIIEEVKNKINENNLKWSFSKFHSFLYMIMLSNKDQSPFSFLAFNLNISENNFKLLYNEFKDYAEKIVNGKGYFCFKYTFHLHRETVIFFENNKNYIELCEILGKILFQDPMIINLFIIFKIWAVNQNICMDYTGISENKIFDDSLILYFIFMFLIQIGEINKFNDYAYYDDVNKKFIVNEKILLNDIYSINKDNAFLNEKKIKDNNSKLKRLGKLFINFLFFILQLIEKSQEINKEKIFFLEISLNSYSFNKRKIEKSFYSKQDKQLQLMHVKNSKNFIFYEYNKNELLLLQKTIENSLNLILEEKYGLVFCSLK